MRTSILCAVLCTISCADTNQPQAVVPKMSPGAGKVSTVIEAKTRQKPPEPENAIQPRTDLPTYATTDVAIVGKKRISAVTYNRSVLRDLSMAYVNGREPSTPAKLREQLIELELLSQAAVDYVPKVTEQRLDRQYDMETRWGGWAYTPQPEERATELEHGYLGSIEMSKTEYREELRRSMAIWMMYEAEQPIDPPYVKDQLANARPTSYHGFVRFDRIEIPAKQKSKAEQIRKQLISGATLHEIQSKNASVIVRRRFFSSPKANEHLMELNPGDLSEPYDQLGKVMIARIIDIEPSTVGITDAHAIEEITRQYYKNHRAAHRAKALERLKKKTTTVEFLKSVHTNDTFSMAKWREARNALPPIVYDD